MGHGGNLLLLFTGLYLLSPSSFQTYHLAKENMKWRQAQLYCREKYSDLATIHNPDILTRLNSSVDLTNVDAFWIGLSDRPYNWDWRWSLTDSDFYGDRGTGFRNWKPGQPVNKGKDACVSTGISRQWSAQDCDEKFPYLCSDGMKFVYYPHNKTWKQAQLHCRQKHADLASVRDEKDISELSTVVEQDGVPVWIGLYRKLWAWSDGSTSSYRNWAAGAPYYEKGKKCVVVDLNKGGVWKNRQCSSRRYFLCSSVSSPVAKHQQVLRLKIRTDELNLNDPAVYKRILDRLQQQVLKQGVPEGTVLRWRTRENGLVFQKEEECCRDTV